MGIFTILLKCRRICPPCTTDPKIYQVYQIPLPRESKNLNLTEQVLILYVIVSVHPSKQIPYNITVLISSRRRNNIVTTYDVSVLLELHGSSSTEPVQIESYLTMYATSLDSEHPTHPHCLISVYATSI